MKDGGWIPLDKRFVHFLPKKRPYTTLEAMFSYTLDLNNGTENSINGYARIWSWSRCKVRRFITDLKTVARHVSDRDETGTRQEVRIIINNLEEHKDSDKTGARQGQDSGKTTTVNPNNNPNKVKRFVPPSPEEVKAYCFERKNSVNIEKWFSHYQSNGWKVGRNKMVDWKAAVRKWEEDGSKQHKTFTVQKMDNTKQVMVDFLVQGGKNEAIGQRELHLING